MYNLDQLLSYLVFITIITFIFERIIENLLIPLMPPAPKTEAGMEPGASKGTTFRTYITLFLTFAFGLGLALSNSRFRLLGGGLGIEAMPLIDSILSAALMAGGSQPLHSLVEYTRKKNN